MEDPDVRPTDTGAADPRERLRRLYELNSLDAHEFRASVSSSSVALVGAGLEPGCLLVSPSLLVLGSLGTKAEESGQQVQKDDDGQTEATLTSIASSLGRPQPLLNALSLLLLRPCATLMLVRSHLVRTLLLDLVARWLTLIESNSSDLSKVFCPVHIENGADSPSLSPLTAAKKHDRNGHRKHGNDHLLRLCLLAFSKLIPVAPQVFVFAIACFEKLAVSPISLLMTLLQQTPSATAVHVEVIRALYNLTRTQHVAAFMQMWDFAPLFELLERNHALLDPLFVAYAAHTMANVLNMSDKERADCFNKYLGSFLDSDAHPGPVQQRILLLRMIEEEVVQLERGEMFRAPHQSLAESPVVCEITAQDLTPYIVDIAGVLLPKPELKNVSSSAAGVTPRKVTKLVWTNTTRKNLNRIAISVSMGAPVLVTGGAGVGKTCLIEEVARLVGQKDLLKIHLGDQTDSKILLGTYVCQSEPGSFRWQPGILTTAVMNGRWVLIEDLDLAPTEVLSVLIPLLETGHLFIPARGEKVRAKQGFQLFATQTVTASSHKIRVSRGGGSADMGSSLWNKIVVDALPGSEMREVVRMLHPVLGDTFSDMIVGAFERIVVMFRTSLGVNRAVSFRDVIKWCNRLERLHSGIFDTTLSDGSTSTNTSGISLQAREALFREALECFTMMIQDRKVRHRAMAILSEILEVPEARLEFYMEHYLPVLGDSSLQLQQSTTKRGSGKKETPKVSVGRVTLRFTPTATKTFQTGATFANTSLSLRLLEKISVCVSMQESVLLTGETGTGKTTIIQQLASMCGKSLTVINMSQQSDSTDLLGGFKPIEATMIAMPMLERFEALFGRTFSATANAAFLESIRGAYIKKKWDVLKTGFGNAVRMADKVLGLSKANNPGEPQAKKSKKLQNDPSLMADWEEFSTHVKSFSAQLDHLKNSFLFSFVEGTLVKAITRGDWILLDEVNLASAETLESLSGILQSPSGSLLLLERGDTEPLNRHPDFRLFACMNPANDAGKRDLPPGLLSRFTEMWVDSPDTVPQDLALIIRRHLHSCLPPPTQGGNAIVNDISEFHTAAKASAEAGFLVDGSGHKVNINLRTLTRALGFASSVATTYGLRRGVYEGCQMTYATILGKDSLDVVAKIFEKHLMNGIKNLGSFLKSIPKMPAGQEDGHILFGSYWIKRGPLEANEAPKYVLTPSVETNLNRLARAVMSSRFPVLIQGPTSAGKTSMVEYLATRTGHRFIRVNNHEHTDLQEYIGTYVSDAEGKLVFREGVLVEALRKGHWIVLDELNLAPSDVLESLNRLLDDNRELLIPETQEIVRPHPGFMLFATQNPPGLYGGRKQLSRAFRSRFIELHFDDIPEPELSIILERRCRLPPSYSTKIVSSYKGLQNARKRSRIFEGKNAFATLRDLFRWGNRPADSLQELAENGFMVLAEKSRREDEKDVVREVLEQIFKIKLDPTPLYDREWNLFMSKVDSTSDFVKQIVWTNAMKRLFVLVLKSITNLEPILLVGETGCGKTTVCQILTTLMGINLQIVNAHAGSETSDFIGSMRPVRGRERTAAQALERIATLWEDIAKLTHLESDVTTASNINLIFSEANNNLQIMLDMLKYRIANFIDAPESWSSNLRDIETLCQQSKKMFEWSDGPLVTSMRIGEAFLLDEISLADDSVLERLNSVLESERLLVLAERGAVNFDDTDSKDPTHSHIEEIRGHKNFFFMATMNPGGDYGKKELSPALRNRFTELWVPSIGDRLDLTMIIDQRLGPLKGIVEPGLMEHISGLLLNFLDWFASKLNMPRTSIVSLRDIMAWVGFITTMVKQGSSGANTMVMLLCNSVFHGGCMVLLDGIGVNPLFGSMLGSSAAADFRRYCSRKLASDVHVTFLSTMNSMSLDQFFTDISFMENIHVTRTDTHFGISPFLIKCGPELRKDVKFALQAPTTAVNALRVFRALRLSKPVLLEGSPGVGKSSLISALAASTGYSLCRINLSEQTDLMDLFGSDLPVEGGRGGEFAWRDGPFLSAMKTGQWVLLDELNLATQQVLEGLNACLDHRASVYIPELSRSFDCHPNFRVFAAQNPQNQGGGRKGLPKSFVNRFTQVYIEALTGEDMVFIVSNLHPNVDHKVVKKMIEFNQAMHEETMMKHSFGSRGSPWEFNLRDILRWIELLVSGGNSGIDNLNNPHSFLEMMYCQRMRTKSDATAVAALFRSYFGEYVSTQCGFEISSDQVRVGSSSLLRTDRRFPHTRGYVSGEKLEILASQLPTLESLIKCIEMSWMAILCGPSSSGKTSLVRMLAKLAGQQLDEFSMNSGIDAVELLGGFEQVDLSRREQDILRLIEHTLECIFRYTAFSVLSKSSETVFQLQSRLRSLYSSDPLQIDSAIELLEEMREVISSMDAGLAKFIVSSGAKLPDEVTRFCKQLQLLQLSGYHGQFEWIDGTLIRALEEGRWILIDNANLCPASVLDRLNHLLEPNGVLIVNERGLVNGQIKVIVPHPNFRMFMTMDPQLGEISRAMRNRGVELFMHTKSSNESADLQSKQDIIDLLNAIGLPGVEFPTKLQILHEQINVVFQKLHLPVEESKTALSKFARLVVERMERGSMWSVSAAKTAFDTVIDPNILDAVSSELSLTIIDALTNVLEYNAASDSKLPLQIEPAIWPIRVSGRFIVEESALSQISTELSLLAKFSYRNDRVTLASPHTLPSDKRDLLLPTPSNQNLLRSASLKFVESCRTKGDFLLKLAAIDFLASSHSTIASFHHLKMASATSEVLRPLISPDDRKNIPVLFLLRELELIEDHLCSKSSLTVISLSRKFHLGHLSEHKLAHPSLKYIYSFSAHLREIMQSLVVASVVEKYDDFRKIAYSIEYLLNLLDCETLKHMEFIFSFQNTLQLIQTCKPLAKEISKPSFGSTERLIEAIDGCYNSLGIREYECLSSLWKNASVVTLRRESLIKLEQEFDVIGKRLGLVDKKITDIVSSALMDVEAKIKHSMLEAVSTLYYLDASPVAETESMTEILSKLPTEIAMHLNKLDFQNKSKTRFFEIENPLQEPLSHLESLGTRGMRFGLTPITDIKSLRAQKLIILKLSELLLADSSIVEKKHALMSLASDISACIEYEIEETLNSAQNLLPFQRMVWILNAKWSDTLLDDDLVNLLKDVLLEATYRWHQRAWTNSCTMLLSSPNFNRDSIICNGNVHETPKETSDVGEESQGPGLLLQSISSKLALSLLGSLHKVPIYSFESKTTQIRKLLSVFSEPALPNFVTLSTQSDINIVFLIFGQVLQGHEKWFGADVLSGLMKNLHDLWISVRGIVHPRVVVLKEAIKTALAVMPVKSRGYLISLLDGLEAFVHSGMNLTHLGKVWIAVSMAFLRSYLPSTAIDPALSSQAQIDSLLVINDRVKSEILTSLELEYVLKSPSVSSFANEFEELRDNDISLKRIQNRMVYRPIQSQIVSIVNDLSHIGNNVLRDEIIEMCLAEGVDRKQIQFLQEGLSSFIMRMESKYPLYRDILQPVFLSLYQLRLGLVMVSSNLANQEVSPRLNQLLCGMLQFLGVIDTDTFDHAAFSESIANLALVLSKDTEINTLVAEIRRFCWFIKYQNSLSSSDLSVIHIWFNELSTRWIEAETLVSEREREKAELYKYKERTHEVLNEEQIEAAELLEVFPDFFDDFEEEPDDSKPDGPGQPPVKQTKMTPPESADACSLDDTVAFELRELHADLFNSSPIVSNEQQRKNYASVYTRSFECAAQICNGVVNPMEFEFELLSKAGQIVVADLRLESLLPSDENAPVSDSFDFYRDPSIGEAQRLQKILKSLDIKVSTLIDEWPDNSILLHLRIMHNRIASFSITSPIMKFLTGVELLFQKCHEWESYASSKVSLKIHLEEMTCLIVRWRKLELESWKNLLKVEDRLAETKSSKLWFHLFKSLIGPALLHASSDEDSQIVIPASELVATLDQLFLSSTIGEFRGRLSLIFTFYKHLQIIRNESKNSKAIDSMLTVIWNVHKYYSQFVDFVKIYVDNLRKPIVKELDGYVRIATWKDVNVFALKESSKRSHYHLHKFVKKYREILSLPVKDVITLHAQEIVSDGTVVVGKKGRGPLSVYSPNEESLVMETPPISISLDSSAQDIGKFLNRMQVLSRGMISDTQSTQIRDGIEDLVSTVLERIQFYQAPTEPGSTAVKGQRMIRKKALVDLLKYLEYLGLSPNSSMRHSKQQESSFIFSEKSFDLAEKLNNLMPQHGFDDRMNQTSANLWQQSDTNYYKLLSRISIARESSRSFNRDLTDREMSKSMSFLDELLHLIIVQRRDLVAALQIFDSKLILASQRCFDQLRHVETSGTPIKASVSSTNTLIYRHSRAVDQIDAYLTQLLIVIETVAKSDASVAACVKQVQEIQNMLEPIRANIKTTHNTFYVKDGGEFSPFIPSSAIVSSVEATSSGIEATLIALEATVSSHPSMSWCLDTVISRVSGVHAACKASMEDFAAAGLAPPNSSVELSTMTSLSKSLVDAILVAFQDLRQHKSRSDFDLNQNAAETADDMDQFGLFQGALSQTTMEFHKIFKDSRLKVISAILVRLFTSIENLNSETDVVAASNLVGHVYPLLKQFLHMYQFKIHQYITFHRATTKLAYILSNSFTILFKKGFCIPKDEDGSDDQDNQDEEHANGMGIGEGEGSKDVSDEIEDESQVEGLKNDANEAPKPDKKMKEEKDGVEMEGDFDGALEDVSDDGEGDDGDEKEEKELDEEQMGDLDRDLADDVDEKLWDGDDKEDQDGKTEKDSRAQSQPGDKDELVAKEDDSSGQPDKQEKPDTQPEESKTEPEEGQGGDEEDEGDVLEMPEDRINEDNQFEDNTGLKPSSSIEEDDSQDKGNEEEKDAMEELPDDLNLDDKEGKADDFEDVDMDAQKDRQDSPIPDESNAADEMDEDQPFPEEEPDTHMERLDENANEENMAEQEDDPMVADEEPLPNAGQNENPDMLSAEPEENGADDEEEQDVQQQSKARDRNLGNSDTQKIKDNIVNAAAENDNERKDDSKNDPNATADSGQDSQQRDGGKNDVAREKETADSMEESQQQKEKDSDFNPHRSLGDATMKWVNRFKNLFDKDPTVEESKPDAVESSEDDVQDSSNLEFEFVENEDAAFDSQVLQAADSEQVSKMDQKALAEENAREVEAMEVDDDAEPIVDAKSNNPDENPERDMQQDSSEDQGRVKGVPKLGQVSDQDQELDEGDSDENHDDKQAAKHGLNDDESADFDGVDEKMDARNDAELELEPLTDDELQKLRQQLQESTEQWRQTGQDLTEARNLWRQYSTLTRELSFSLCESLRLILEPTLATKLKGDYRAGKRLNMRKVIAYIASQFKKDKIWLRRTRPSKRTYQIMISIDDSRSMAESKSIELAFESLSLISKALTQLEVGEISVVSFGEDVRQLHPFDKPFSDEAGAEVIHNFTFGQDGTKVRQMMEATLDILKTARQTCQGSAELWQLQIIISDGILEDHAAVRALVRQAANARIMVVFVVLDRRGDRDSILRMTNVSYTASGLQMTRYMDTFPFDFYVVLSRIEDLPEVLSDTLRQYFMFVNL